MKKLTNALKNRALQVVALGSVATLSAGSVFAETTTTDIEFIDVGVSASQVASELGSTVGPWILGAFGIAGTIFAVKFGWRLIRNFSNRS